MVAKLKGRQEERIKGNRQSEKKSEGWLAGAKRRQRLGSLHGGFTSFRRHGSVVPNRERYVEMRGGAGGRACG